MATAASASESSRVKEKKDDAKKRAFKDEIDAKRKFIASVPDWGEISTREGLYDRANHVKQLAEMEYEYELLLETERIDSVFREHKELYPPYTEECPICLEDIPVGSSPSMVRFPCCGKGLCRNCCEASIGRLNDKCPLCRADFSTMSNEEKADILIKCAGNGRSWAQAEVGHNYMSGTDGYPLNKKNGLQLIMLAAEQKFPAAMFVLAMLYEEGNGVEQSYSKAQDFMTKAANLGNTGAQRILALWYYHGKKGFAANKSKALYYVTLCCSHEQSADLDYLLGFLHLGGEGGLRKSLYLAKHYFEKSADGGYELAYHDYGASLFNLWQKQYNGVNIPGHSAIPRILQLFRKAAANGVSNAAIWVHDIEKSGKQFCHYCNKKASSINGTLKCCAKCKGAWYCGKDCQVKAWKEGHKIDCIKHE